MNQAIRISCRNDEQRVLVAGNWARRINECLVRCRPGTDAVKWYENPAPAGEATRSAIVHHFAINERGRPASHVQLAWQAAEPGGLKITAGGESLPMTESLVGRIFGLLALMAAVAAFLLWIWFVYENVGRVWNRVTSFRGGYDAEHASKLAVGWLLVGWAVGPVFAGLGVGMVGAWFNEQVHRWRQKRAGAFARKHLDAPLQSAIDAALKECTTDSQILMNLGQNHPGTPHPVHPNIIYGEKGDLQPAPGFTWVNAADPKSFAVKPAERHSGLG